MNLRPLAVPLLLLLPFAPLPAEAQDAPAAPAIYRGVSTAERADVSPPLRDMVPGKPMGGKAEREELESDLMQACGPMEKLDPVAQLSAGVSPRDMPGTVASWNGFPNLCGGCAPPDPNGDIGPNHYVAMANSSIAVYSRAGAVLLSPRDINTIWSGFGGACQSENAGDPVVLHDQFADRWLISQFTAAGPTYYNCVALSVTADPTGSWQRYAFTTGANFPDYPKYGIWRDGYYISTREFDSGNAFAGAGAYALNRAQMLAGSLSPQVISFIQPPGSTSYYPGDGLLPADVDGNTQPPAGADELYLGSMDNGGPYAAPQDAINVFKFHVDWATPANSSFARSATVPVAAFDSTFTPCGGSRACIPQQGTANKLDILSYRQRLLHRAGYRNMGSYQTIVTNQSVQGVSSPTAIAGVRWYELRDPNGTPTIYQQGTYVPGASDGIHRWMGSVAMDRVGNLGMGYSASSGTIFPDIRYTGRLATDPLGQMPQGEGSIVAGGGAQTGGGNRWGDYSSMNIDPTDDCTFWYVNEYYTATSAATWNLRVGAFRFPNCICPTPVTAPVATSATASAANQITVFWNDSSSATVAQYLLFHSTVPGGPYTQISTTADSSPGVGGSGTYSKIDSTVSGGTTYYYVLQSTDGANCTSGYSNEVSATATGICALPPTFAGLSTVTNPATATCTLNLSWSAATSNCSAGVTYNVYRSTTTPVNPTVGNRIASGISGTAYSDNTGLSSGTTYYYVVRAVDVPSGNEDGNVVEKSGAPTGPITSGTFTETFEGALSGGGFDNAGWVHQAVAGTTDWAWSTARSQSPTHSWFSQSLPSIADRVLVTPTFGVLPGTSLSFWHTYAFEGTVATCYDAGTLEISTDGGAAWTVLPDAAFTAGGFTGTTNAGFSNPIAGKRAWCAGTIAALTQVTASLGAYAGATNAKLRWHAGDDSTAFATGWYVDSVTITNAGTAGSCTTGAGCTPPGAPSLAVPTVSCSGVSLSWSPGTGSTASYNVYRANGGCPGSGWTRIAGPLVVTTYNDTTGTPGASYAYMVRGACDAGGSVESIDGNCRSVTASGTPAAPAAPTLSPTCNSMGLSWSGVAGATDYEVWGIPGASCAGAVQIASTTAGATTFNHSPLSPGAQYSYFLKAENACGASAAGTCAMATTGGLPSFSGVGTVTNPGSATCTLQLTWPAATPGCSGATITYRVYRSTSTPVVPGLPTRIATGVASTGYTDAVGLTSGLTYYYRVHAVDGISSLEDSNSTELSGVPTGPVSTQTLAETFEAGSGFDLAGWTHGPVGGVTDWTWSTAQNHSATHSWLAADVASVSDKVLTTPPVTLGATSTLSFWHTYRFATKNGGGLCVDGGTLEITTDGGTNWNTVPAARFTAGAYNGAINDIANVLNGRAAYCGGTVAAMTQATLDLSTYSGSLARFRWHEADSGHSGSGGYSTGVGWFVDDVTLGNVLVTGSCTTGSSAGPKPAPDGVFVTGTPMRGTKSGGSVAVTWDVSTCTAADYAFYWGSIGSWSAFTGGSCAVGATGAATSPIPADAFWIVAGTAGGTLSTFGKDSTGAHEVMTGWSSLCPAHTAQDTAATCP